MSFPGFVDINWLVFSPALVLVITAALTLLYGLSERNSKVAAAISVIGLISAAAFNFVVLQESQHGGVTSSFGMRFLADTPAAALNFIIILGTVMAVLVSWDYLSRTELEHPEYYPLMLLSATGAMIMVSAGDLITLLLGLEITSLAVYVLSAWRQGDRESEEAGMKYFLLGAFASAFLIYGIALLYGATGTFLLDGIVAAVTAPGYEQMLLATLGGVLILGGLAFKAAIVPFHQWAPDVYTGAPTPVTTFMSVVVKVGAFGALLRIASGVLPGLPPAVLETFSWLVGLTMLIGNFGALAQQGVKRMLAYSSVAHAGYLGLAILAGAEGIRATTWYLMAYAFMTAGAFAVLTMVSGRDDKGDSLERLAGLGRRKPVLAACMALFMLSLAGIPPLAGFTGKLLVFSAAISAGYLLLAVLGILTSVVAIYYYFRVINVMYFRENSPYELPVRPNQTAGAAVAIAVAGTVLFGLFPGWWYDLVRLGGGVLAGQ
jgi:NADH-quinone oxidoreductase subunit N